MSLKNEEMGLVYGWSHEDSYTDGKFYYGDLSNNEDLDGLPACLPADLEC